ncbi:uncharacterized protein zgc:112980 isoform X2 [Clupea harengus]|uniref:Uncharacterized protein zgc:112980 isoform X2 n=1 Tax=Clupea harengus TaxID=7950 RepID=A0A6P8F4U7_CLUHA|nr:uncharacterized protein zgc:112980 isoform X2 [Clupea harengus]
MDSVIILSSSEDDSDTEPSLLEPSVLVVEEALPVLKHQENSEVVDDDLSITYTQKGMVLPHARSDCPAHPFRETAGPELGNTHTSELNISFCEQCFCYVCDAPASECEVWRSHCDAHPRCSLWRSQREIRTLGTLHKLGFTVEDMDEELRTAEHSLHIFSQTLSKHFSTFQQSGLRPVFECVSEFVSKAEQENLKTGAVMMLGATQLFLTHPQPHNTGSCEPLVDLKDEAVYLLLHRVFDWLLQVCVDVTLPSPVVHKLQVVCSSLTVPHNCKTVWLSVLAVRVWDDPLLVAVLKGQNVSGRSKKTKSILQESSAVVTTRVRHLLHQKRYREVARYLKVVESDKTSVVQELRDMVPLYLCQAGDFQAALEALFSPIGHTPACPASRLTPPTLHAYLRVFTTGQVPRPHPSTEHHPMAACQWEPIKGVRALKTPQVVKFALRVLHYNNSTFSDVPTWENLVVFVSSERESSTRVNLTAFPQPDVQFLKLNMWALRWLFQRLSDNLSLQSLISTALKELLQPHPRTLSPDENIFIADFLCFYFLEGECLAPPITNVLLANWNESYFPWQFHLRQALEQWSAGLSPEKYNILQRMKAAVTTY